MERFVIEFACTKHRLNGPTQYSLQKQQTILEDDDLIGKHSDLDVFQLVKDAGIQNNLLIFNNF